MRKLGWTCEQEHEPIKVKLGLLYRRFIHCVAPGSEALK